MCGNPRLFLFGLGITFSAVFQVTKSIFILGPFYIPFDSLYADVTSRLEMSFEATRALLLTLRLTTSLIVGAAIICRKRKGIGMHDER